MSYSPVPTVVTGDTWTASQHNTYIRDNFAAVYNDIIPIGGIILWSGSIASIPANWALCNGSNGTPDLRDRFVIGAGNTYAVDATGGSTTKNIAHTHTQGNTGSESSHTHGVSGDTDGGSGSTTHTDGSGTNVIPFIAHTHYINLQSGAGSSHSHTNPTTDSGGSSTQDIMPPYYALAYIMRIS